MSAEEIPVKALDRPNICSIDDLPSVSDMPVEEIDFLVDGFLAYSTVNMLSGEPGCGKSSIALKFCYCVATGSPFAGLDVKRGHALYLDAEQPKPVIQEKFQRLDIADGVRFKYWGPWAGSPPALNSPLLAKYVADRNPKPLIVVDSFVKAHDGDENSSTETRAFMDSARFLANLGACVLFLHHTGKAETAKNYRGSSDIPAGLDAGWLVSNLGEDGRLGKLRLKAFKTRIAVTLDSIFEYANGDFAANARRDEISKTVTGQLSDLLRQHPDIKRSEFEAEAAKRGLGRNRARVFLDNGAAAGTVIETAGEKRNIKLYRLAISDPSRDELASSPPPKGCGDVANCFDSPTRQLKKTLGGKLASSELSTTLDRRQYANSPPQTAIRHHIAGGEFTGEFETAPETAHVEVEL